jgi:hypothetical protein
MNPNEDHELWNLLGKAREPKVSPYFSRNVLRALRSQEQDLENRSLLSRIRQWCARTLIGIRWVPVSATAALLIGAVLALPIRRESSRQTDINQIAQVIASSPDYGVISQLDELLASEEGNLWLDSSPL